MEDITTSNNIHTLSIEPQKECFCTDDGWSHVFTFLGEGHYLLLALVSKRFAKLYAKLYQKVTYGDISGHCLTYAKFFLSEWDHLLPFQPEGMHKFSSEWTMWLPFQPESMHDRIKYRDNKEFTLSYIERCAAKCGMIEILEWIYELEGVYRLELLGDASILESLQEKIRLGRGKLARRMAVVQVGEAAAEANQVKVLKFLLEKYRLIEEDSAFLYKLVKNAAGKGHFQCIKFLNENGCCTDERERIYDCQSAARHGQLACLKYLKEQGWSVDVSVMLEAAEAGHLHCIKYLRSVGCPWEDEDDDSEFEISAACAGSSLECLIYCHENGCDADFYDCCMAAVKNGKIDCIEYLRSKGCPWNADFIDKAVEYDQFDCLQYLHKNGCPWEPADLIDEALRYGSLDCLKYLLRVGTALPNNYASTLSNRKFRAKHQYEECLGYCLQYLKETGQDDSRDLILTAIQHGLAQTLQHFSSEEMKNDATIAGHAANYGQFECLTYLHENGFRWDENSYNGYMGNVAGMPSHMDCLRYMKEHQLDTNQNALLRTICVGHTYCIDFLIKDEWKSDSTFCMGAIRTGNYNCFELLIEIGFAFDSKLCAIEAAKVGNIACLEYMHMNGHELPKEALDAAESNGHLECVEYIKQHFQCQCKDENSRKRSANDAKLVNV